MLADSVEATASHQEHPGADYSSARSAPVPAHPFDASGQALSVSKGAYFGGQQPLGRQDLEGDLLQELDEPERQAERWRVDTQPRFS